jgi:SulP family sulfate permease
MEPTNIITEIISGFTIALLLIPESIAFSFILGLPPSTGLISSAIMSSVTSTIGGSPTLISGATAAIATSLVGVNTLYGKEYIFLTVIIGGILQLLFGISGLYKHILNISQPVITGFLIALGFLIAKSQIANLKDVKTGLWFTNTDYKLTVTLLFSLISLFIAVFGKLIHSISFRTKQLKIIIPGGLLSILVLGLLLAISPIKNIVEVVGTRGDSKISNFAFNVPNVELTSANILKVLPFAVAMALTGLTESIFMVKDASKILNSTANPFVETLAQGVGNIITGLCGGIGGCVLVGQSKYNLENGSKTILSSRATSLFFIALTLFFSKAINNIPMPAIIGIMTMIAFNTATANYKYILKNFKSEWLIIILTASLGIYSESLALAIIVGSIVQQAIKYIKSV